MIKASVVMILIYSPFQIAIERKDDMLLCVAETGKRLGEMMQVRAWDNMGGSNPIPKVVSVFCAEGVVQE